jgi:hypothetical protein
MLHNKMLVLSSLLTMASASAAIVQLDQLTSDQLLSPYNQRCQGDMSCLNSRFNEPVNIVVSPMTLHYGEVAYNGLPVSVDSRVYTVRNCTSLPRTQSTSFGTQKVSGIKIETKDSVVTGQKLTREVNLKFPVGSSKFGSSLKSSYEKTVDFSTAGMAESTTSIFETVYVNTIVPPYTVKIVKYNSIALSGKLPLTATGKINGTTRFGDYSTVVSAPYVTLAGDLLAFEHNEIRHEFYEYPQGNATACRNFSIPAAAASPSHGLQASTLPEHNVHPLTEESADVKVATPSPLMVRVRLPDNASACPVTFNFGRDQIAVLGRGGIWSDWQVLSVADSKKQRLTMAHNCDSTPQIEYSLVSE